MKDLSNTSLQLLNNLIHITLRKSMFPRNSLLFPKIIFDLLIAMYLLLFDKLNICELEEIIEETKKLSAGINVECKWCNFKIYTTLKFWKEEEDILTDIILYNQ